MIYRISKKKKTGKEKETKTKRRKSKEQGEIVMQQASIRSSVEDSVSLLLLNKWSCPSEIVSVTSHWLYRARPLTTYHRCRTRGSTETAGQANLPQNHSLTVCSGSVLAKISRLTVDFAYAHNNRCLFHWQSQYFLS